MTRNSLLSIFLLMLTAGMCLSDALHAQNMPQREARAIIDTLRWGFDYKSAEANRRAKRAQQLDSTYYISHLIEGFHHYDKAEEMTGLRKAVPPLRRALRQFKREFGYVIDKRYTREDIFGGAWQQMLRQIDYFTLASTLTEVYISLEMPDSAYAALTAMRDDNLVFDFRSYQGLAWIYFRSRIYTKERYPFLKNSIEENIKTAFLYTDSLEQKYKRAVPYFRREILSAYPEGSGFHNFFYNSFVKRPPGFVANTRGILYGYDFEPQLAAKYFLKMDGEDNLAKNVNLGYTYHSDVDLKTAEDYFSKVVADGSKSRGGHWQGYSTVFVYKGEPLEGALKLRQERDQHGFTIGYGWDNLCLARMYLYAGLIDDASLALDKAEEFTEVHFNTSFREDQYRFMLKALRLLTIEMENGARKFENRNHWVSWNWLKEAPRLTWLKYNYVYDLANELAQNPEREIVYYHIFHSESIISFDELWFLADQLSNGFLREKFASLMESDPRENMRRYYQYFIARLMISDGQSEAAFDKLTAILTDPTLDKTYEKLLIARIHQQCAAIAEEQDWLPQMEFHLNELYRIYPQLMPFGDVAMRFRLQLSNDLDLESPAIARLLGEIRDCEIVWDSPENQRYPEVQIFKAEQGKIQYQVFFNRDVITQGLIDPSRPGAGKKLAYRLFKIRI